MTGADQWLKDRFVTGVVVRPDGYALEASATKENKRSWKTLPGTVFAIYWQYLNLHLEQVLV